MVSRVAHPEPRVIWWAACTAPRFLRMEMHQREVPTLWQLLVDLEQNATPLREVHKTIRARMRAARRRRTTQRTKGPKQ